MVHLLLLAITLFVFGCADDQPINTVDKASTTGIYFYEEGEYNRYIEVPNFGVGVYRGKAPKDYRLDVLANEEYCYFVPTRFVSRAGKERWMKVINEEIYLQTATVGAGGDIFLSFDDVSQPELDDESFMFIIHEFDPVGDRASVAVESVSHPGYFFTYEGHLLTGNGVALKQFSSPEKAPRWLVHHDRTVTEVDDVD